MSKVLYFHGFMSAAPKTFADTKRLDMLPKIAGGMENIIAFDAPFSAPDNPAKHYWFMNPTAENKNHNPIPEINKSAEFIVQKLRETGENPADLILCGASQGGFMALYLTLNGIIKPKKTIAIVPFYSLDFLQNAAKINKSTPILWAAAGKDDMIPPELAGTWKDIKALGLPLDYVNDPASSHGEWTPDFKNKIIEWAHAKHK